MSRFALGFAVVGILVGCGSEFQDSSEGLHEPPPSVSSSATFRDAVGSAVPNFVRFCGGSGQADCPTAPSVQVRWGGGFNESGLGFEPTAVQDVLFDQPFAIGALTHFNFVVGRFVDSVVLDLGLVVESDSGTTLFDETVSVGLEIEETPNNDTTIPCPFPSERPCSDRVTISTDGATEFSTVVDGFEYTLTIAGFHADPNASGPPLMDFLSEENESTVVFLFVSFDEECIDGDGDGVCDVDDACANTASGSLIDADGCSIDDHCPCDTAANHGDYVSCVAHATTDFVRDGLLTHQERSKLVSAAARSDCGK